MARVEIVRRDLLASPHAESVMVTERGTQGGFGHWGKSRKSRRASSFSASPSANPVGVRKSMRRLPSTFLRAVIAVAAIALLAPSGAAADSGGAAYVPPPPPAKRAKIVDGIAIPPVGAPARVKNAIAAANRIIRKPYVYGGGHTTFRGHPNTTALERGYDCSGTVSFALYGGRFPQDRTRLRQLHALGRPRRGPLDHRLHEPRPRLRGDRWAPPRHEWRRPYGPRGAQLRQRASLAQVHPFTDWLHCPPPCGLLARQRAGTAVRFTARAAGRPNACVLRRRSGRGGTGLRRQAGL